MPRDTLAVTGYRELLRACDRSGKETKKQVRQALRQVGGAVRDDAAQRFAGYSGRSAAGFKVRVRQRGVAVEQSLRKTTGLRPDYGALQMRKALLPARHENAAAIDQAFDHALDRIIETFDR